MGQALPKPVESAVLERKATKQFRCGVAEVNGYRNNMEDAHLIHMRDTWAFFGVFDGHGGDQCSKYVAEHLARKLEEQGCPADDEEVKKFILDTDQAFLDTQQPSGSTAAMCIVHKPTAPGGKHTLRVVNAGDSRVLLGKRNGEIVDGGGTDSGLSTDHKPNHPSERERIYRCGGTVEEAGGGVHRVNGDLAVSRGFGDAEYKKTGGPGPEDRPVTANPELGRFECDDADFLVIVCDGVSEGDFSNQQVITLIAESLESTKEDLCEISRQVCLKAIATNSKDNITCMIVLFEEAKGATLPDGKDFVPGPIPHPESKPFMTAYAAMAAKVGKTQHEAAAARYEYLKGLIANAPSNGVSNEKKKEYEDEVATFGDVPAGSLDDAATREKIISYFETWLQEKTERGANTGEPDINAGGGDLLSFLRNNPNSQAAVLRQLMQGGAVERGEPPKQPVRAAELATLKQSVQDNSKLQWDDRLEKIAGTVGNKIRDDPSDGTSQVTFEREGFTCWLPTHVLTDEPAAEEGASAAP